MNFLIYACKFRRLPPKPRLFLRGRPRAAGAGRDPVLTTIGFCSKIFCNYKLKPLRSKGCKTLMNDDPSGTAHAASVLPVPAAAALLIVFFLLGILYAMCDSAVTTASESRVKRDAENGSRRAKKFLAYLDANESFASPLQFGMMLMGFFSIGVSVLGFTPALDNALIAAGLLPGLAAAAAVVLCMLLCAVLFLLAADFIPKKFVAHKAARSLQYNYKLIGLIRTLSASMRPLMRLCDLISDGVMRLFGNDPRALDETVTEEEILHMVGEGEEKGVIEETELDMITNILDFNDTTVSEIMTHRTDICAVSEDSTIEDVAAVSAEKGFSRLPVYREDIDTITGICYVKDFLPYVGKPMPDFIRLRDMVRPAYFIPETKIQPAFPRAAGAAHPDRRDRRRIRRYVGPHHAGGPDRIDPRQHPGRVRQRGGRDFPGQRERIHRGRHDLHRRDLRPDRREPA